MTTYTPAQVRELAEEKAGTDTGDMLFALADQVEAQLTAVGAGGVQRLIFQQKPLEPEFAKLLADNRYDLATKDTK
jgi:hypothetical protein